MNDLFLNQTEGKQAIDWWLIKNMISGPMLLFPGSGEKYEFLCVSDEDI